MQADIIDFLGDSMGTEEVQNSILTEEEKNDLDIELTIGEFDAAVKQTKKNTAPGIDGFGYGFIHFFWPYLRDPFFKCAKYCFETSTLTENLKTAKIRIIPKKGGVNSIKNWRPISLLSCFYKILSRVLANRLEKYMDRITTVGQKSASKNKICQKVLIDLLVGIQSCRTKNKKGAILSLDIKKAFDSTGHSFIHEVYKFFNFGPNIIRWLTLTCTNRKACVILSGDRLGEIFNFERGNAQGDTISPFIFNLGFQILLFKLNFDLQIKPIVTVPDIPEDLTPIRQDVSKKPRKVFTFADDNNILTELDYGSLNRIKIILAEFKELSGLECDVEKSVLMQVGAIEPVSQEIKDLGFVIQKKLRF